MKAFGYDKANVDTNSPTELSEAMLYLTIAEIDKVIAFLEFARDKFVHGKPIFPHAHQHLSLWDSEWKPEQSDLVIYFGGTSGTFTLDPHD
jgi:hypothetical protein